MTYFEALLLGIVQGLAEFLPISSSGHMALLQNFFGIEGDKVLFFSVMLHIGTLVAVFVVYWRDIWELILELIDTIKDILAGKGPRFYCNETRKFGYYIIIATIPTAIMGLLLNDFFEGLYSNIAFIGLGLLITGTVLLISERMGSASKGIKEMKLNNAFFIGVCQGIALWPGISRSGSTLFGGLFAGLNKKFAVKFAFIVSIPSIMGSVVLELPKAVSDGLSEIPWGPLTLGVLVSAIFGYLAIKIMIKIVSDKKLIYFSIYTWLVGIIAIVSTLV